MKKKTIVAIILSMSIILISNICFAVDNNIVSGVAGDAIDGAANVTHDVATGTANMVHDAATGTANVVGDMGRSMANATGNAASAVGNVTGDAMNGISQGMQNMANDNLKSTTTNEYNATAMNYGAPNTFLGMTTSTWWWIILSVVAILAVVLMVYYTGNKTNTDKE